MYSELAVLALPAAAENRNTEIEDQNHTNVIIKYPPNEIPGKGGKGTCPLDWGGRKRRRRNVK